MPLPCLFFCTQGLIAALTRQPPYILRAIAMHAIVFAYSETDPGVYYYYDVARQHLHKLVGSRADFAVARPVASKVFTVRSADGLRFQLHRRMRDDVGIGITRVNHRFENLDFLTGNLRAADPANQFLAFAAEHRTNDHFD